MVRTYQGRTKQGDEAPSPSHGAASFNRARGGCHERLRHQAELQRAAEESGLSVSYLRKLIREGKLPAFKREAGPLNRWRSWKLGAW